MTATYDELMKLEVGDRVRCLSVRGCSCISPGMEYEITRKEGLSYPSFKCTDVNDSPHPITAGEFEIVSTSGPW